MKSTEQHFVLEEGEYLVTVDSINSEKYKVYFDGFEVSDSIVAIIRRSPDANEDTVGLDAIRSSRREINNKEEVLA